MRKIGNIQPKEFKGLDDLALDQNI
uniref:Uncharacterized protein n=1 Tax=Tetranychus urticae TaxID=32264 RepID=T1KGF6_TETUR